MENKEITPTSVANKKLSVADVAMGNTPTTKSTPSKVADVDFMGTSSAGHAKVSDISVETKNYFEGIQQSGTDPNEIAAQGQGWAEQYGKSIASIIPKVADYIIEGVGFVGGAVVGAAVPSLDVMDTATDNFLVNFGHNLNTAVSEYTGIDRIYHTRDYNESTNALWKVFGEGGETLTDATAFLASAFVPGTVFSKLALGTKLAKGASNLSRTLSKLNKASKLGKTGQARKLATEVMNLQVNGIKQYEKVASKITPNAGLIAKNASAIAEKADFMLLHSYNTISEAGFEAKGSADAAVASHLWDADEQGNFISGEDLQALKKDAWEKSFGWNVALLSLTNLPEAAAIFKMTNKTRAITKAGKKSARLTGATEKGTKALKAGYIAPRVAGSMISEGIIEEGGQLGIEHYAAENTGKDVSTIDATGQIFQNLIKGFDTTEGQMSMITGALMGAIFGTTGAFKSHADIMQQGQLHEFLTSFTKQKLHAYKNQIFKTNKDGTFVDGIPQLDEGKIASLVKELKSDDEFKSMILKAANDSDSKALHNYMVDRDFESIIYDAITSGADLSDIMTDIDFYASEQEGMIQALEPSIKKDELAKQVEEKKAQYRRKATELIKSFKNSKGRAFELYAQGLITETEIDSYANEIYNYDAATRSSLNLLHNFTNELSEFENEHGIHKAREYNRVKATIKSHENHVVALDEKIAEIKEDLKADDLNVETTEYLNDTLKEVTNNKKDAEKVLAAKEKEVARLEKKLEGKLPKSGYLVEGKALTKEQEAIYTFKLSALFNMENAIVETYSTRKVFDNPKELKKIVEARSKARQERIDKDKDKFDKLTDKKIVEKINEAVDMAALEELRAIAKTKSGKVQKAFDAKFTKLKEVTQTNKNKEEGSKTEDEIPTPELETPDETPAETPEKKKPLTGDSLIDAVTSIMPGFKVISKSELGKAVDELEQEIDAHLIGKKRGTPLDVLNDQSLRAALSVIINKINNGKTLEAATAETITVLYNTPAGFENVTGNQVKYITRQVKEASKIVEQAIEIQTIEDTKTDNDTLGESKEYTTSLSESSVIATFIPALHPNDKSATSRIIEANDNQLKAIEKLKALNKDKTKVITVKQSEYKTEQGIVKKTVALFVDDVEIGNIHPLDYFQKELANYAKVQNNVKGDLNEWLLNLRNATPDVFFDMAAQAGFDMNKPSDKKAISAIQKRSGFTKNGKPTDTPIDQFTNWIDIMNRELAVATDIWNAVENGKELLFNTDDISIGGFQHLNKSDKPLLVKDIIDMSNSEFVYFRDDNAYDAKTGNIIQTGISIPRGEEGKGSGLIYVRTDKTLNGETILISLKPQPLTKGEKAIMTNIINEYIKDFNAYLISAKSGTTKQAELLKQLNDTIFEQDSNKESNSRYASNVANLTDKKGKHFGFRFNLGVPSKETVQIRFTIDKNGKHSIVLYEYNKGKKSILTYTDNNKKKFEAKLDAYLSEMNGNINFKSIANNSKAFNEQVGQQGLDIQPILKYDENNNAEVVSFTQAEGDKGSENQQLVVKIKYAEKRAKQETPSSPPLGVTSKAKVVTSNLEGISNETTVSDYKFIEAKNNAKGDTEKVKTLETEYEQYKKDVEGLKDEKVNIVSKFAPRVILKEGGVTVINNANQTTAVVKVNDNIYSVNSRYIARENTTDLSDEEYIKLLIGLEVQEESLSERTGIALPIHTIENTDYAMAYTSKNGKIVLADNNDIELLITHLKGDSDKVSSKQKAIVFEQLIKAGYTEEKLRKLLNTTDLVNAFLLLHEQDHIDNNDKDVYFKNGDDLLTDDKVAIELRATLKALSIIESNKPLFDDKGVVQITDVKAEISKTDSNKEVIVKSDEAQVDSEVKTVPPVVNTETKTRPKKRRIGNIKSRKSTQYKTLNLDERRSILASELKTKLSDSEFELVNNLLNAVAGYNNADKIYDIITGDSLRNILDIINGIKSVESLQGKDIYDVGMAMFITKLASEGKFKQATNDRFLADAIGMMFANTSDTNSTEFNAAVMAEEALDILNDISLQYDNRSTLEEEIDMQVIDMRTDVDKHNEAQPSTVGKFMSKASIEYNFKKLIKFLIDAASDFIDVIKSFKGESVRNIFTNPNMEVNIMIKPLAMQNKDLIIEALTNAGATITNQKTTTATSDQIASHYSYLKSESFFGDAVDYYTGKEVHVMSVKVNKKQLTKLNALLGTSHGFAQNVSSLRTQVVGNSWKQLINETGVLDNGIHISKDSKSAVNENNVWFNKGELQHNRKWYNIGMSNRNSSISAKEMNKLFEGLNYHSVHTKTGDALGKIYPHTDTLGNTIIVSNLTNTVLLNIVNRLSNMTNITIKHDLKKGVVTYKFQNEKGEINSVDIRTEKNLVQNFDKNKVKTLVNNYEKVSDNKPPYGKMFNQMRTNLHGNEVALRLLDKAENDYYSNDISPDVKLFSTLGGFETIDRINVKTTLDWMVKNIPQANTSIAEGLIKAADGSLNYGLVQNATIALSDDATFGTEYHEALHFIVDYILPKDLAHEMLLNIQVEYGLETLDQAHEAFADLFRMYSITELVGESPKGVKEMSLFAKEVLEVVANNPAIEELFKDIHQGAYSSTAISEEVAKTRYSAADKTLYNQDRFGFTYSELKNAENLLTGLFLEAIDAESQIIDDEGKVKLIKDITNAERLNVYSVTRIEEDGEYQEEVYANDVIQVMVEKLDLIYNELYEEEDRVFENGTPTEHAEITARISTIEKVIAQLNDYKDETQGLVSDDKTMTMMTKVIRKIKQVHGYGFKTIADVVDAGELSALDSKGVSEAVQSSSELMKETAIHLDPDTSFNPIVKQAIAKLKQVENIYDNNKKVGTKLKPNPLTGQPLYVEFDTFFPKFVSLMVGVSTSEQLQERIDKHKEYIPELSQLNDLLNQDKNFTLKQALLSNLNARISTEYFLDVDDNYKIKSKSKAGKYRFSDQWVNRLTRVHSNTRKSQQLIDRFEAAINKVREVANTNPSAIKMIEAYENVFNVYGINMNVDELYHYAFDDSNAINNVMIEAPIENYRELNDLSKIHLTLGKILTRLTEVNTTLKKNMVMTSTKKKVDGKVVYEKPEYDNYGDLNAIAAVKELYGKEGVKLSYLDVKNNQKNQVTKLNQIGEFMNMLQHESDEVVLSKLIAMTSDPSMKYSNLLITKVRDGKIIHNGMLIPLANGSFILNKEFIANFNYGIIGGVYSGRADKKGLFREGNEIDWLIQKVSYFANGDNKNGYTQLPALTPGDSSNNYIWTTSRYPRAFGYNPTNGDYTFDTTSELADLVYDAFYQEVTRMKQAESLLFTRNDDNTYSYKIEDEVKRKKFLNESGFRKDYHYALDNDGNKLFLENGKPVGLVFKFHNFTSYNDMIDPNTGVLNSKSAYFKEKFGDKTLREVVLEKFKYEMFEEYNTLRTSMETAIADVSPQNANSPAFIFDMLVNQRMHNIEMQNFFTGLTSELPGAFNENGDYMLSAKGQGQTTVRAKSSVQGGTSGTLLDAKGKSMNVKVRYVVHKDLRRNSNSIELIKKVAVSQLIKEGYVVGSDTYNKQLKLILKGLEGIEVSDGGALGTLNRWVEIQKSLGRWDEFKHLFEEPTPRVSNLTGKPMENRFNYTLKKGLTSAELIKSMDAIKPVYTDREMVDIIGIDGKPQSQLKQQFIKYAWFPLTDFLTENNPELKRLQDWMEANDVDEMGPMTTEKQGTDYIGNIAYTKSDQDKNPEHKEGTLIPVDADGVDVLDALVVKETKFEKYRTQLEIVAHAQDHENKLGVQIMKSIIANINPASIYGELTGREIIDKHFDTLNNLFNYDRLELESKLNATSDGSGTMTLHDAKYLKTMIISELERTGLTADTELMLAVSDGVFENVLDSSDQANKILSVLNAQFTNNYKNTKFPGAHLTLMPDTGFRADSMMTEDLFKEYMEARGLNYENEDFSQLKIREVNGVLIADCLMPVPSKDFLDKDGKPMNINDINPKLLEIMGYRIPNTGKHSNVVLNIVGFLPQEVGGLLITPADFVGRTGWDFDIDSVYMMNRNHMRAKEGSNYKFDVLEDSIENDYEAYVEHRKNELVSSMKDTEVGKVLKTTSVKKKIYEKRLKAFRKLHGFHKTEEGKFRYNKYKGEELELFKAELNELKEVVDNARTEYDDAVKAYNTELFDKGLILQEGDVNTMSKAAYQNQLFDTWFTIQTSDNNLLEGLFVSDFTNNNTSRDSLTQLINDSNRQALNPISNVYQTNVYPKAVMDKDNLAIFANYSSMINIHQVVGSKITVAPMVVTKKSLELTTDEFNNLDIINRLMANYVVEEVDAKVILDKLNNGGHIMVKNSNLGRSSKGTFVNIQGQLISHVLSEDIDNAADAIKDYLPQGINTYTKDVYSLIKAIGGTVNLSVLLTNQPIIVEMSKAIAQNKRLDKRADNLGGIRGVRKVLLLQALIDVPTLQADTVKHLYETNDKQSAMKLSKMESIESLEKMTNPILEALWAKLVDTSTLVTSEEALENQIKSFYETGKMSAADQAKVFDYYSSLLSSSQTLNSFNTMLTVDKKEIGNNYNNTFNTIDNIENDMRDWYNDVERDYVTIEHNGEVLLASAVLFPNIHHKILDELAIDRLDINETIDTIVNNKIGSNNYTKDVLNRYPSVSPYPMLETKLINGNLNAQSLASNFMLTENRVLRKQTTGKLNEMLAANFTTTDEIEILQAKLITHIVSSLYNTMFDYALSELSNYSFDVNSYVSNLFDEVDDFLIKNKDLPQHHPFKYIDKDERKDKSTNTYVTTLKLKFIENSTELELINAETNKIVDDMGTAENPIAGSSHEQLLLYRVMVVSYLTSGLRQDSGKLSQLITYHMKDEMNVISDLNNAKAKMDINSGFANMYGQSVLSSFIEAHAYDNKLVPKSRTHIAYNYEGRPYRKVFYTENSGYLTLDISNKNKHPEFFSGTNYFKVITKEFDFENPDAPTAFDLYKLVEVTKKTRTYVKVETPSKLVGSVYNLPTVTTEKSTLDKVTAIDDLVNDELLPQEINERLYGVYMPKGYNTINNQYKNNCK